MYPPICTSSIDAWGGKALKDLTKWFSASHLQRKSQTQRERGGRKQTYVRWRAAGSEWPAGTCAPRRRPTGAALTDLTTKLAAARARVVAPTASSFFPSPLLLCSSGALHQTRRHHQNNNESSSAASWRRGSLTALLTLKSSTVLYWFIYGSV